MNLAQRMIRTFCLNISTSCGQSWTALSDSADDTVRITTRKVVDPGQPNGLILSAVSTTWLPYQHNQVFDFLRDERRRAQVLLRMKISIYVPLVLCLTMLMRSEIFEIICVIHSSKFFQMAIHYMRLLILQMALIPEIASLFSVST